MENSSIIIGIVIALLILVPTFYFATAGKRKLKNNLNKFIESLKSKSIFISDYSQVGEYMIGMDKSLGIIVYKKSNGEPKIIDAKTVVSCINNIPKNKNNVKENLYIELITTDSQKTLLELYDSTFALNPSKEIKVIEDWTNKLTKIIKKY